MSRFSVRDPETRVLGDIVCRKHSSEEMEGWYTVHIVSREQDRMIGQVIRGTYDGWMAISNAPSALQGYRSTRGFKRRWFAIQYLLRAWKGIYEDDGLLSSIPGPTP